MSSTPHELAGALPPPSGTPLPADLAPPVPPAETASFATADSIAPSEAIRPRRVNPDVIVPVGVWPEGTWDPAPEPAPLDATVEGPTIGPSVGPPTIGPSIGPAAAADGEPALFDGAELLPSERTLAARVDTAVGEPVASTLAAATAPAAVRRGGLRGGWSRQPRWAKVGGAAAVLFAAAAAVSVSVDDNPAGPLVAAASTVVATSTPATAAPAPTIAVVSSVATAPPTTAAPTTAAPTTAAPTTAAATTAATAAPTTVAPAPVTVPGTPAADVLATVPVAAERTSGFAVTQFPVDPAASTDGCDVRATVLRRDSLGPVQAAPEDACRIVAGSWRTAYDGVTTDDPAALVLDRTVSLREVWESGASTWTAGQRATFLADVADPRTARLTSAAVARAKGDRDASAWLPEGEARCAYLADYLSVKARWGLSMDRPEADRVRTVLNADCPGLVVSPWSAMPPPAELPTPTTVPYYLDCADAARRGVTSIPRGAPGFRDALDGNGNGIACE